MSAPPFPSRNRGPRWAPASTAAIHPGVETITASGQCTSNFIFYDTAGSDLFIGQAAHCSTTGGATDTNGCTSGTLPVGTPVDIQGGTVDGVMVYNSWATMQEIGETDPNACAFNDFALVKIDPADVAKVNPSVPFWGGPKGLNSAGAPKGSVVYTYGNSQLRLGLTLLSPLRGRSKGDEGGGWSHVVTTLLTPGIPGDSGSAVLDSSGKALGVLSTLRVGVPTLITNGVGNLRHELDYLHENSEFDTVQLALGTESFNGKKFPLALPPPL